MRVLAADDDAVTRIAVKGMINSLGYSCALARTGLEAWNLLQDEMFDVVIVDRLMPDMDGLELCRRIRARPAGTPYVYVVMASGLSDPARIRDGMVAGADDYLVKPVRLQKLETRLIAAERVSRLHRRLESLNGDLSGANAGLLSANQFQADVIAMLGHDARQPLTGILGFSEILVTDWEETAEDTRRAIAARIHRAAKSVDQLLEDVLTMAGLESGTLVSHPRPVPADQMIGEVLDLVGGDVPVTVHVLADVQILADPWQLRQILVNLIGNALKYGQPPFQVRVGPDDENPALARIVVTDHGEGVPVEFVPHLFERFTRAVSGVARHKPGTGFGLYLAQRLVEANSGSIVHQPVDPHGCSFVIALPMPPHDPETDPEPTTARTPETTGPTPPHVSHISAQ